MQNYLLVTCEILLIVVMPLLVLYLKGNWPLRKIIPSLVIIPVFWYFSYTILHELSHAAGLYLVGGKAIDHRTHSKILVGPIQWCMGHTKWNSPKLATINVSFFPIPAGHCLFGCSDICLQARFFQESFFYWFCFHASVPPTGI